MASIIESFRDLEDLIWHFGTDRASRDHPDNKMAYNLRGLLRNDRRTVEFRGHTGSLDYDEIDRWVKLVCELVLTSHFPANLFLGLMDLYPDFDALLDLVDLLDLIGLDHMSEKFQGHVYQHSPNLEIPDRFLPEDTSWIKEEEAESWMEEDDWRMEEADSQAEEG